MKWHWYLLLIGLGIYGFALFPGFLPHEADGPVAILAGMIFATLAIFGFDSTHVDRRLAIAMVLVSVVMLSIGAVLALQGHTYILLLLSVPAVGLGLFSLRKIFYEREKHE